MFTRFILFCCKFSAFFITTKTFSLFFSSFLEKSWPLLKKILQKGILWPSFSVF